MTMNDKSDKFKSIPLDKMIIGLSLLVFIWILMPCMFSHQTAVPIVLIIGAVLILMYMDNQLTAQHRKEIVFRYLFCGIMSLYLWLIGRSDSYSSIIEYVGYVANNIIIWFPVAFSYYILYRKPDNFLLKIILFVLIFFSVITGITSFIGLQKIPMAARWLAGAHTSAMLNRLRSMNIGGYSYIYAMGILFPIALGFLLCSNNSTLWNRIISLIAVLLLPIVIFFSQYMTALYMVIYTLLAVGIFVIADAVNRITRGKPIPNKAMLIVLPLAVILFVAIRMPLHYVIRNVSHSLGLTSLEARAQGVIMTSTTVEYRDEIWKTLSQEDGIFDEDFNARGDAIVARSKMYSQLINTVPYSPLFGRLTDSRVRISNHSEFLDGLLGGGIFGALCYLLLLYFIFGGLVKQVLAPTKLYGSVLLMGCLLVGLGAVNPLTKSREIILMCTVLPITAVLLIDGTTDNKLNEP